MLFSIYGVALWFPEYFKRFRQQTANNESETVPDQTNNTSQIDVQFYQDTLVIASLGILGTFVGMALVIPLGGKILAG